jgi:two-component system, cell cycle sensor histidine kinase and response regulator CckA
MDRADLEQWKPKEVARLLALVETERRYYQEIVANVPVSLLVVGPDCKIVSANRHFRVSTGRKNDEILNHDLAEIFPVEGALELAQQVVRSGVAAPRAQSTWTYADKERPVALTALPLRSWEEDSDAEALLVIQEMEAADPTLPVLSPKQAKAVELTEAVDAMLWEADLSAGRITYVNEGAVALFGHPEAEWLENPEIWADRVHPEDRERIKNFYEHLQESDSSRFSCEFRAIHQKGHILHVRESVRAQRDETGKITKLFGYTTDISERREKEEQHAIAQKSEALGRLSAKLAHDLNNLLMIIAGYGEELKNSVPSGNPLHNDMREILAATERLYSITTQLQTYTRRPIITPQSTSVPALLEASRPAIERVIGHNAKLILEHDADLRKAKVDGEQVQQALVALAQHAYLELGGEGTITITASHARLQESVGNDSGLDAGDYLRLSITHSGSALSAEARERILEPWLYSEDGVREIKMGLSTAYHIVRASKGDISVESSAAEAISSGGIVSHGTAFHVYLPLMSRAEMAAELAALAAAPEVAPPAAVEVPVVSESTLETILVVEDEGGIRALVRKILKRQGYNVLEAAGGEEALRIMAEHPGQLDLLLTDVMMPGMNGVELSYKALEAKPNLKVLFVSGYTDESLLEAGQFPSGTAFLQKPFTLGSLLGKVRDVLNSTAMRQSAS